MRKIVALLVVDVAVVVVLVMVVVDVTVAVLVIAVVEFTSIQDLEISKFVFVCL